MNDDNGYIVIKKSKAVRNIVKGIFVLTLFLGWSLTIKLVEHILMVYKSPNITFGIATYSLFYGLIIGVISFMLFDATWQGEK